MAPHLGIEDPNPAHRVELALEAIEALAAPVLIVLDDLTQWCACVPWPRPRGAHIRWLATTCIRDLGDRVFHYCTLPLLEPAASRELLVQRAGEQSKLTYGLELRTLYGRTLERSLGEVWQLSPGPALSLEWTRTRSLMCFDAGSLR